MAWGGAACGFVIGSVGCAIWVLIALFWYEDIATGFERILIGGGVLSAAGFLWGTYLGCTDMKSARSERGTEPYRDTRVA